MKYNEDNCEVTANEEIFSFTGRIETSDYSSFSIFLENAENEIAKERVIYDFKNLSFLNSSGIRALAVHLLRSKKKYTIKIEKSLTWQRVGIIPLSKLRAADDIIVEW